MSKTADAKSLVYIIDHEWRLKRFRVDNRFEEVYGNEGVSYTNQILIGSRPEFDKIVHFFKAKPDKTLHSDTTEFYFQFRDWRFSFTWPERALVYDREDHANPRNVAIILDKLGVDRYSLNYNFSGITDRLHGMVSRSVEVANVEDFNNLSIVLDKDVIRRDDRRVELEFFQDGWRYYSVLPKNPGQAKRHSKIYKINKLQQGQ
jgi:hypothetical protein